MNEFCTKCGTTYREGDEFCGKCGTPRAAAPAPAVSAPAVPAPAPAASPTAPASGGVRLFPILMGVLLPVGGILFFVFGVGDCSGSTEGNMRVAGARGNFTFTPTGCASMQPRGYFGANIHGEGNNDGAVYVTIDPIRGSFVNIEIPGSCQNSDGTDCTVFEVPRDHCSVFQAHVENTNTTVNDVRVVEGNVRLQCQLEDGTTVSGRIVFEGCS